MRIVAALAGLVVLISGIVMGAGARQQALYLLGVTDAQPVDELTEEPSESSALSDDPPSAPYGKSANLDPGEAGGSLLGQAHNMLAQIEAVETGVQTATQKQLMSSVPNCSADPAPGVNWSGCDKSGIVLNGVDLRGANLVSVNFSGSELLASDLSGAHLDEADFSGSKLEGLLLRHSRLTGANFNGAHLYFMDMTGADLSGADFSDTIVDSTLFLDGKAIDTNFRRARILFSNLSRADLRGISLDGGELRVVFLQESNLQDASITNGSVDVIDLSAANIEGLQLDASAFRLLVWFKETRGTPSGTVDISDGHFICPDGSYVAGAVTGALSALCDWSGVPAPVPSVPTTATCSAAAAPGVNWSGCNKSGVKLEGVDLRGANLQGTDFSGGEITFTDLRGAIMQDADFSDATIFFSDLHDADLRRANLSGEYSVAFADLGAVDLRGANLSSRSFQDTILSYADLRGANLTDMDLNEVNLGYTDLSTPAGGLPVSWQGIFAIGPNLTGIDLSGIQLDRAFFLQAQIADLDFSAAALQGPIWFKDALGVPVSSDDLSMQDTLICPAGEAVFGPLSSDAVGLCAWQACWQGIEDGDFERQSSAWYLPATEYSAAFSKEQAESADWSVRTGIIEPGDNTYSFSSVRQRVTLPAGTSPAILSFSLYPQTTEPLDYLIPHSLEEALLAENVNPIWGGRGSRIGDAQWVIILDNKGNQLMRPVSMRSNGQAWTSYQVDLSPLVNPEKDRTIEVYFGTFNNGRGGVTGMYVDNVALSSCPGETLPKSEPPPAVCKEAIIQGGFEVTDSSWLLPLTPYPAAYSDLQRFNGRYAMRTGITEENGNVKSFSSALQRVSIPADATAADLNFHLFAKSSEDYKMLIPESIETVLAPTARSMNYGDAQWVLVLDEKGRELQRLVSTRSNEQAWRGYEFNLLPFKGKTILLYFGTFNNGWDGRTAMFVDDVALNVCAPDAPEPVMALTDLERGE